MTDERSNEELVAILKISHHAVFVGAAMELADRLRDGRAILAESDKQEATPRLLIGVCPPELRAESIASDKQEAVAEVIKWQTFTGHTAWDFKVFDKTLEHGAKLYAAPIAQSAEQDRIDAERYRFLRDKMRFSSPTGDIPTMTLAFPRSKQMTEQLKPCPFCGGEAHIEQRGTRRQSCIVECGSCGLRHDSGDEGDRCGTSWNRRAIESRVLTESDKQEAVDAEPVAWRIFDGEGNYDYTDTPPSDSSVHHASMYGRKFEPLYAHPIASADVRFIEKLPEKREAKYDPLGLSWDNGYDHGWNDAIDAAIAEGSSK